MSKTNGVIEEGVRRFQQILEYTTYHRGYNTEAAAPEDQEQDPAMGGDAPAGNGPAIGGGMPQDGGMPQGDPSMGGGMPQGDPSMGGGQGQNTPQGLNPQEQPEDPSMGEDMPQDNGMPMDQPIGDGMPQEDPSMGGEVGPDDDVIDISELTDKQDETEDAIKDVADKFEKVIKNIEKWQDMIDDNNKRIDDLKSEIEKRNPTQIEKLGMQTAKSYPFNVTPNEYWSEKEKTSNYRVEDDNNGKGQGQYVITAKDLSDTDWKKISDSLSDEEIYHPTVKNAIGYGL